MGTGVRCDHPLATLGTAGPQPSAATARTTSMDTSGAGSVGWTEDVILRFFSNFVRFRASTAAFGAFGAVRAAAVRANGPAAAA